MLSSPALRFSREKVRLTDEIERAEQQVLRCQDAIRDAVHFCEEAGGDRAIPQDAYDSEGEVDASDIFCGRCHEMESYDDNDIVMCDGPCNRAYHEACLSPRLVAAELPEDEGWLCPACDAKVKGLHQISVGSYVIQVGGGSKCKLNWVGRRVKGHLAKSCACMKMVTL